MHSVSSEYYNKWDKRLGIPVILLGAAATSSIFTTTSDSNNIWAYINGGMVLLMTGVSGVSKFLGINEKLSKHTSAAFKYTEISMNIDTLLSFPRADREEKPREFINSIKTCILEIREHAPDLPTWVISSYIKKLDKSLISTNTKINRSETLNTLNNLDSVPTPIKETENNQNQKNPNITQKECKIRIENDLYKMGDNSKELEKLSDKLSKHDSSEPDSDQDYMNLPTNI